MTQAVSDARLDELRLDELIRYRRYTVHCAGDVRAALRELKASRQAVREAREIIQRARDWAMEVEYGCHYKHEPPVAVIDPMDAWLEAHPVE